MGYVLTQSAHWISSHSSHTLQAQRPDSPLSWSPVAQQLTSYPALSLTALPIWTPRISPSKTLSLLIRRNFYFCWGHFSVSRLTHTPDLGPQPPSYPWSRTPPESPGRPSNKLSHASVVPSRRTFCRNPQDTRSILQARKAPLQVAVELQILSGLGVQQWWEQSQRGVPSYQRKEEELS